MNIIKTSLVALIATTFCIWLLRPLAIRLGFVDRPGGRKTHSHDIPLIGGVAMFFGFCFSLLTLHLSLEAYRGMIAGSALLMLVGVVDDFQGLSSKLRLLIQVVAALLLIIWGHEIVNNLGNIFFVGNVQLGMWAFPVTIMFIVGYINAMNMVDGQDGLAGGVALGQVLLLLLLSWHLGRGVDFDVLVIVAVLLLVFLSFNMHLPWRKRASIFMGDSGITFIAFIISWFAVNLAQMNNHIVRPITLLWVLAFPLFDLVNVVVHRLIQGDSIFQPSRDHLHHVLHIAGVNTALSTILLWLLSFSLGLTGLLLNHFNVAEGWQFLLYISLLVIYVLIVQIAREPVVKTWQY
jgi:UDP-GlcNAc:undecaprenyl-phosphate/decaprenyl-phosphate GlcNAc-1-phosphate transferase